jgi:hypothetical protein
MHTFVRVLLSLVIGLRMVVLYRALRAASPPREPLSYRKIAVTYRIVKGRHGRIEGVHVGIELPDRVRFRLQPESGFDRRAKQLGLATEWQVNDAEFDYNVFVVSDDPIFLRALANDRELRKHSHSVFLLAEKRAVVVITTTNYGERQSHALTLKLLTRDLIPSL